MLFKLSNTLGIGILVLIFLISCNTGNQKKYELNQTSSLIKKKPNKMTVLSPIMPTSPKKINSELLDDSCFTINTDIVWYIKEDWKSHRYLEINNNRINEIYNNGRDLIIRYNEFLQKYGDCDIILIYRDSISKSCMVVSQLKSKQPIYYSNLSRSNINLIMKNIINHSQSFKGYRIEIKPKLNKNTNYSKREIRYIPVDNIMNFKDIKIIEKISR